MNIGDLIYAFFTHAGPGGIMVLAVIATAGTIYYMLTRWILQGAEVEEALTVREARARRRAERQQRRAERRRQGVFGD